MVKVTEVLAVQMERNRQRQKIARAKELVKDSGYDEPGKRDGTGPYKGSYMRSKGKKGRRQMAGEKCPAKEDKEKKAQEKMAAFTQRVKEACEKHNVKSAAGFLSRVGDVAKGLGQKAWTGVKETAKAHPYATGALGGTLGATGGYAIGQSALKGYEGLTGDKPGGTVSRVVPAMMTGTGLVEGADVLSPGITGKATGAIMDRAKTLLSRLRGVI